MSDSNPLLEQTVRIVEAYLSNHNSRIQPEELSGLLNRVYSSLSGLSEVLRVQDRFQEPVPAPAKKLAEVVQEEEGNGLPPFPFVPIRDAVREDAVTCLICGRECQALRGHLTRTHGVDEETYRKHFKLPKEFPLVAPAYSAERRRQTLGGSSTKV